MRPILPVVVALLVAAGCTRDAREWECPDLEPGDLVITEVRGEQTGADSYGQWVELENLTGGDVALGGLLLVIGDHVGGEWRVPVRERELLVPAGGRVVLGRQPRGDEDAWIDYGFLEDYDTSLPANGLLEIWACDRQIDRVVYRDLPRAGSLSFDGALAPDATANDVEADWCVDATPSTEPGGLVGLPGTPGEENRPCA